MAFIWETVRVWLKRAFGASEKRFHDELMSSNVPVAHSADPVRPPLPYWERIDLHAGLHYSERPAYLNDLTQEEFEQLLPIAIQAFGGHVPRVAEYRHISLSSGMVTEVAIRMLEFHMYTVRKLQEWRESDVVQGFEIVHARDSCGFCKTFPRGPYHLDDGPEVPLKGCTHKLGCRCTIIPKVSDSQTADHHKPHR
ncbi:hypothetical protein [Burkholderia sp. JKS000303]|uniref:hypothetical protein n=1 Tax=Burkholderia sp. JKS000303 TaxID=1938747 RepID=UPI000C01F1AE|nr:hypothetical protein [Burkholderia sp. JKS000303]PFH29105.1 hypothetical protein BX604_2877 [Burkholderia sp. JKS000303]